MIVYKIDKQDQIYVSKQIKDMAVVLDEIAPTLKTLQSLVIKHRQSISTPTIDTYTDNLLNAIEGAMKLSEITANNSQQLCLASDQAVKHLVAIDEHFGKVLRDKTENAKVDPASKVLG